MNYETQDWEFKLKDMVFSVFYQWKGILALAVVLALVLGSVMGLRTHQANENAVASNAQPNPVYEAELEQFELQRSIQEARVEDARVRAENHEEYLEESVLLNLDYLNTYEAVGSIFFDVNYQIMPNMDYQNPDDTSTIVALYQTALANNALINQISEEVEIRTKYLKEIVSVSATTANILTITVWHSDAVVAEKILDLYMKNVELVKPEIEEYICEHTTNVVIKTVGLYVGDYIANRQVTEKDRLWDWSEEYLAQKNALEAMQAPQAPQGAVTESVMGNAVKGALIGGFAGVFVYAVVVCCVFIFFNNLYSADELHSRLNVKIVGTVVDRKKRFDPITRFLRSSEGRPVENTDNSLEVIVENLRAYAGGAKKLLVTGSVDDGRIQMLADSLQEKMTDVKLVFCGNILSSPEALRILKQCEGVLLVEKCGKSKYGVIVHELERIADAGIPLVGSIILD